MQSVGSCGHREGHGGATGTHDQVVGSVGVVPVAKHLDTVVGAPAAAAALITVSPW